MTSIMSKKPSAYRKVMWDDIVIVVPFRMWKNAYGDLHRHHGPAIEYDNGEKSWYIHGKIIPPNAGP